MRLPPIDCLFYHPPSYPQPGRSSPSSSTLPVGAAAAAAAATAYPSSRTMESTSTGMRTQPSLLTTDSSSASVSSSGYVSGSGSSVSASASAPASAPTSPTSPSLSSSPRLSSSPPPPTTVPFLPPLSLSSSSSTSSTTLSVTALNRIIRRVLRRPKIRVVQTKELEIPVSSIHPRYLLTLSSSPSSPPDEPCIPLPQLMLTLPPRSHTKLLRIEQKSLETEVSVYQILTAHSDVKVPRVLAYDFTPRTLKGTPFILTTVVADPGQGLPLAGGKQVQRLVKRIGRVKSSTSVFGPLNTISSSSAGGKTPCDSWRQAFNLLLEGALRDGEDMLVSLPYGAIRATFRKLSPALDGVRESRLVLLGLKQEDGRASVVVDEDGGEIAGLIGCGGWVVWGDILMAKVFDGEDVLEEIGKKKVEYDDDEKDRKMLYLIYRCVLEIVEENYRPRIEERELEARKRLTSIFRILSKGDE